MNPAKASSITFLRHCLGWPAPLELMGPKTAEHPSVGVSCLLCDEPMRVGDYTTLVPLGPGLDSEAQQRAREGRWFSCIAVEVHYACATGRDPKR